MFYVRSVGCIFCAVDGVLVARIVIPVRINLFTLGNFTVNLLNFVLITVDSLLAMTSYFNL